MEKLGFIFHVLPDDGFFILNLSEVVCIKTSINKRRFALLKSGKSIYIPDSLLNYTIWKAFQAFIPQAGGTIVNVDIPPHWLGEEKTNG